MGRFLLQNKRRFLGRQGRERIIEEKSIETGAYVRGWLLEVRASERPSDTGDLMHR